MAVGDSSAVIRVRTQTPEAPRRQMLPEICDFEFGAVLGDGMALLAEALGLLLRAGRSFRAEGSVFEDDTPIGGNGRVLRGELLFRGAGNQVEEDSGHERAGETLH